MHLICLLVLLFISSKYYHIISNNMGVMACTRFWLQGRYPHNEESESCLSCTEYAYWSSSFLPNIIKICLWVTKLWSAQDVGFRGDNYIMKKVSVVSSAHDTPTGPPLHFYQILSYYLKQYGSYCLHKIFCFRGGNYLMKKVKVVSLACDMPTGPPLHSYQILPKYV